MQLDVAEEWQGEPFEDNQSRDGDQREDELAGQLNSGRQFEPVVEQPEEKRAQASNEQAIQAGKIVAVVASSEDTTPRRNADRGRERYEQCYATQAGHLAFVRPATARPVHDAQPVPQAAGEGGKEKRQDNGYAKDE